MSARLTAYRILAQLAVDADDTDESAADDLRSLLDVLWRQLTDAERVALAGAEAERDEALERAKNAEHLEGDAKDHLIAQQNRANRQRLRAEKAEVALETLRDAADALSHESHNLRDAVRGHDEDYPIQNRVDACALAGTTYRRVRDEVMRPIPSGMIVRLEEKERNRLQDETYESRLSTPALRALDEAYRRDQETDK